MVIIKVFKTLIIKDIAAGLNRSWSNFCRRKKKIAIGPERSLSDGGTRSY